MKSKIMGLVVTALLAVVVSTGFATVAKAAQVSINPTGKFKTLLDNRDYGAFQKSVPDSMVQGKDGMYTVTVHDGDTVGVQFKCTKGYYPMCINEDKYVSFEGGYVTETWKTTQDFIPMNCFPKYETKTYSKVYQFRSAKLVKVGKYNIMKYFGPVVKVKFVVKPNLDATEYYPAGVEGFVEALNKDRRAAGLNEVSITPECQAYADTRAMELTQVYSHARPNGVEKEAYSEAILAGGIMMDGLGAFQQFKDSAPHYATLMQSNVSEFGVSCVAVGKSVFVCVNLGTSAPDGYDPFEGWGE